MEDLRFRVGIRKFQFRVSGFQGLGFRVEDLRFRVGIRKFQFRVSGFRV